MSLTPNRVEYSMTLIFREDDVDLKVEFTGESVRFDAKENTMIRPRHIKLISEIQLMIREYLRR